MDIQGLIESAAVRGYYVKPLPHQDGVYIARTSDVESAILHRGAQNIPCATVLRVEYDLNGPSAIEGAIAVLEKS